MARTVDEAFSEFVTHTVNLDPDQTKRARGSRDWLITQLHSLHTTNPDFPRPYKEKDVFFGSFQRRTKIRPLDDIDLISVLTSEGSTYLDYGSEVRISVPPDADRLRRLCHDNTNELNSRKTINRFVQALSGIPQYRRADIGRDGEAAVLALDSHPWSFDIVPGFFTTPEADGRTYYLIPDAKGHWKKTDPRIDQQRATSVNQAHDGNVLPAIRLMKFWNRRPTMPSIPPYAFEAMILSHYEATLSQASSYIDLQVVPLLETIAWAVFQPIPDPKRIQGDLNQLSAAERVAISMRAQQDAKTARAAWEAESTGDHLTSIRRWSDVFGPKFPSYD